MFFLNHRVGHESDSTVKKMFRGAALGSHRSDLSSYRTGMGPNKVLGMIEHPFFAREPLMYSTAVSRRLKQAKHNKITKHTYVCDVHFVTEGPTSNTKNLFRINV